MFTSVVDRLERIRELEEQRSRIAAEHAREVALLMAESRAEVEAEIAGLTHPEVKARRQERAERQLVAQIATARRLSPDQTKRWITWAVAAPLDTPDTFALLEAGALSEKRAQIVFREVSPLSPEDRRLVDVGIAAKLAGWGDQKLANKTRTAVQTLDPAGACKRAAYAANQRRVTVRPAPEGMAWFTALLPMVQAVACRAALEQDAKTAKAAGDPRGRGQVMADTMVERITGQATAPAVPLDVQLVITDTALLGTSNVPARLTDGTPLPAPLARAMVLDTDAAMRIRRLFCDPVGRLVTAETNARDFTKAMRDFVALRDETCTTDWCDAPVRHVDHHHPHTRGGRTSLLNARGTCAWCNETKADRIPEPTPPLTTPAPTRPPGRRQRRSRVERIAKRRIAAAVRRRPAVCRVDLSPSAWNAGALSSSGQETSWLRTSS